MDKYQLKGLINLLEQFRHEYNSDSIEINVYIAYVLKAIEKKLEEVKQR